MDKGLQKKVDDWKAGKQSGASTVRVIIQTTGDPDTQGVTTSVSKSGGKNVQKFSVLTGLAAEMPIETLESIGADPAVQRISEDLPVANHAGSNGNGNTT